MLGTGFYALEPDIIVTCFHVVKDATSITAKDSSGNEYKIEGIIDHSESLDIAILKSFKQGKMLTLDANLPSPGTTTALYTGKNITTEDGYCQNLIEVGWYNKNSDDKTHPVGQKEPNAWGIYDMYGNVWEWCNDWYGCYPSCDVTDPTGENRGSFRARRGGGWNYDAKFCRSANRGLSFPDLGSDYLGFRLALVPVD